MKEEHQLTPNMQAFFDKLLELKSFVKKKTEQNFINVDEASCDFDEIYKRLDAIIKEKNNA